MPRPPRYPLIGVPQHVIQRARQKPRWSRMQNFSYFCFFLSPISLLAVVGFTVQPTNSDFVRTRSGRSLNRLTVHAVFVVLEAS